MLHKKGKEANYKNLEKENANIYCFNFKPKRSKKVKVSQDQIISHILKDQINGWDYQPSPVY